MNRKNFLLIVSSLTAACSAKASYQSSGVIKVGAPQPYLASASATVSVSSSSSASAPSSESPPSEETSPPSEEGGASSEEPTYESSPSLELLVPPSEETEISAKVVGSCSGQDRAGPRPQCSRFTFPNLNQNSGPASELSLCLNRSYFDFCQKANRYLKPTLAQRAVQCAKALLIQEKTCDHKPLRECFELARGTACRDLTTDKVCSVMTRQCQEVSMGTCRTMLAGLTEAGRSRMEQCFQTTKECRRALMQCTNGLSE